MRAKRVMCAKRVYSGRSACKARAARDAHEVRDADGGTLLDDAASIRRRSFSHSDLTRLSPPRPTARAASDALARPKSSGYLTHV